MTIVAKRNSASSKSSKSGKSALDASAFKTYDIRGLYPSQINEELAYRVGKAFVQFMKAKKVVVGMDMRTSSESLKSKLIRGITEQGATAIDIGMVTTPMLSFAVVYYKYDCGIMISASHNPSNYNAFKLVKFPTLQLDASSGIGDIKKLVVANKFQPARIKGRHIKISIINDYINHVLKFSNISDMKIVCDYGNGVGAISARPFFEKLENKNKKNKDAGKIEVIHLYEEPDGTFPNHPANPHDIKNLSDLRKRVLKEKADIGFFFDGDADRSFVVDEKGQVQFPDMILPLLAEKSLFEHPSEKVYYDLRFSKVTAEKITEYGGKPVMMRVGNPFYKRKMIEEGGILAGELSGHIMFKENFSIDDGLFTAVKLLNILSEKKKSARETKKSAKSVRQNAKAKTKTTTKGLPTLSKLIKPLQKYYQTKEINMHVADATKTLKKVEKEVMKEIKGGKRIKLDGVLVHFKDWWFSLRMSQTEPLVRLRIEANTKKKRDEMKKKIVKIITDFDDKTKPPKTMQTKATQNAKKTAKKVIKNLSIDLSKSIDRKTSNRKS